MCLVSELVTLCSWVFNKWLLLPELISQESERGDEMFEGLLAELQGNILISLLGSIVTLCGVAQASVRSRSHPPPLEKMKT